VAWRHQAIPQHQAIARRRAVPQRRAIPLHRASRRRASRRRALRLQETSGPHQVIGPLPPHPRSSRPPRHPRFLLSPPRPRARYLGRRAPIPADLLRRCRRRPPLSRPRSRPPLEPARSARAGVLLRRIPRWSLLLLPVPGTSLLSAGIPRASLRLRLPSRRAPPPCRGGRPSAWRPAQATAKWARRARTGARSPPPPLPPPRTRRTGRSPPRHATGPTGSPQRRLRAGAAERRQAAVEPSPYSCRDHRRARPGARQPGRKRRSSLEF
jgi:hypothetical protein